MGEFLTIPEIITVAKEKLPREAWDYVAGGAGTETTVRRNRAALDRYLFRPRVLRDVSQRSTRAQFLGHTLAFPVMLAPVGSVASYHPDGALAVARVAGRLNIMGFVGLLASPALEEVMTGATGPMVLQLYWSGDRAWVESLVRRVEASGYAALCITVDEPIHAVRDRNVRNRYAAPRAGVPPNLTEIGLHPEYWATLTWEEIGWVRSLTELPLVLKGIALDASGVAIGRLMCCALAAGGDEGLQQALEILRVEMDTTMANIGVSNLLELGPEYLTQEAMPVPSEPLLYDQD